MVLAAWWDSADVPGMADAIHSGGSRIWPVLVENSVASHPAVLEVAAVGFPDATLGELAGAVVVLKEDHAATEVRRMRDAGA